MKTIIPELHGTFMASYPRLRGRRKLPLWPARRALLRIIWAYLNYNNLQNLIVQGLYKEVRIYRVEAGSGVVSVSSGLYNICQTQGFF